MYVVRKNKGHQEKGEGEYKDSAPCTRCADFMKKLNIKYIIYSNNIGTLTKCKVRDYTTNHISQGTRFINRGMKPRETVNE